MSDLPLESSGELSQNDKWGWHVMAAPVGIGSILLGPHSEGAQVIAPWGVVTPMPEGCKDHFSEFGWRLAIWPRYGHTQNINFRHDRFVLPLSVQSLSFREAIAAVRLATADRPEEWTEAAEWFQTQAKLHWLSRRVIAEAMREDGKSEEAAMFESEGQELLLDMTQEFGEAAVKKLIAPPQLEIVEGPHSAPLHAVQTVRVN